MRLVRAQIEFGRLAAYASNVCACAHTGSVRRLLMCEMPFVTNLN